MITSGGRPAYVVNVEVYLHRGQRWLLIQRSDQEAHAPGILAGPGGKVEVEGAEPVEDVVEMTARREVLEEIGIVIDEVQLTYVESGYFRADDGDPVINIVVAGAMPEAAEPYAVSDEEVAGLLWLTAEEAQDHPKCPPWTRRALGKAERVRKIG